MKPRIIFLGGALRAVPVFKAIAMRDDISIEMAIFMKGYQDEWSFADQLATISKQHHIDYVITDSITKEIFQKVKSIQPQLVLIGGTWRSLLKNEFLQVAEYGCISLHATELPQYRGWACVNWYIINGEKEHVNTMFQLDDGIDSGPLVARKNGALFQLRFNIEGKYFGEVLEELAGLRVKVYHEFLDCFIKEDIVLIPQDHSLAGFTCNRSPEDGVIDWNTSTQELLHFIRGQSYPAPGAYSYYENKKIILWRASRPENEKKYIGRIPGKVVARNDSGTVDVLTGDGILRIEAISVDGEPVTPKKFISSVRQTLGYKPEKAIEDLEKRIQYLEEKLKNVTA